MYDIANFSYGYGEENIIHKYKKMKYITLKNANKFLRY